MSPGNTKDQFKSVLNVARENGECLATHLARNKWRIFSFHGGESVDTVFEAINSQLPQEFPVSGRKWWSDGLNDSLGGGLIDLGVARAAIVWLDCDRLLRANSELFRQCTEGFADVCFDMDFERAQGRHAPVLRTFLVGDGPMFPARHEEQIMELALE